MLSNDIISSVLARSLVTGGDFAEIFVEDSLSTNINMLNGKIENRISGRTYGIGIRIFKGLKSVYAYTNNSSLDSLLQTAEKAALALGELKEDISIILNEKIIYNNHPIIYLPNTVESSKKIEVMRNGYLAARDYHEEIKQVGVNYIDKIQNVLIANTEGLLKEDRRVRTRLSISSVASLNGENQTGSESPGAHMGFELFEKIDSEAVGREASRIAHTMLHAKNCPAGKMTVAIDNGFGGVIFHEACGHSLEATAVAKGNSVFSNMIGKQIASIKVTAIDDGTLKNEWGSLNIDDEGNETTRNVLIKDGILQGYMVDKLNGRRMGMKATGSSRRESYKFAPTSRMTNTFIDAGNDDEAEIIKSIENGLYAKKMGGGSVNPVTGEFNFSVSEGYLVKDGVIQDPVRGASLIGKGSEILMNIDMVGKKLAHGQGMCGSVSGSIPANVGQPMIRVSEITVGGR